MVSQTARGARAAGGGRAPLAGIGPAGAIAGVAALCAVATALFVGVPGLWVAYPRQNLQVALETGTALTALLAGFLMAGPLRDSGRASAVMLASALGLFAGTNFGFAAIPAASDAGVGAAARWTVVAGTLIAAGLLAAASRRPSRDLGPRRAASVAAIICLPLAAVAVVAVLLDSFASRLPVGPPPRDAPTTLVLRDLADAWPIVMAQTTGMALFAVAAAGFTRQVRRTRDPLFAWLAIAAVVAAFAQLNYALHPSLRPEWVVAGDLLRLAFYVVLLAAALHEIRRYWRTTAAIAVLDERRRIARELHDGLAQELAFIARRAGTGARRGDAGAAQIAAAAGRALDEARRALSVLADPLDEPFERSLEQAVATVAARTGAAVRLDVQPGVALPPDARVHLTRIACEAVVNAARHAHASEIRVDLVAGARPVLRVSDDGVGFDPAAAAGARDRFGLAGMRDRAAALGSELHVSSSPGSGTTVEVVLP